MTQYTCRMGLFYTETSGRGPFASETFELLPEKTQVQKLEGLQNPPVSAKMYRLPLQVLDKFWIIHYNLDRFEA